MCVVRRGRMACHVIPIESAMGGGGGGGLLFLHALICIYERDVFFDLLYL